MTIYGSVSKVKVGAAWVSFKGTNLGFTKGGITFELTESSEKIYVGQSAATPVRDVITNRNVLVTVPLAESDYTRMIAMFVGASGYSITASIGTDLMLHTGALVITPIRGRGGSITIPMASPKLNVKTVLNYKGVRVWPVVFEGYISGSSDTLVSFSYES
jgi:hypothetical protein